MTMVTILAAPGGLLVAIVGLAAILAMYQRRRKRTLRQREQITNGLHPAASSVASEPSPRAPQSSQRELDLSLQDDDDYPRPSSKQPDLIHPKRGTTTFWIPLQQGHDLEKHHLR